MTLYELQQAVTCIVCRRPITGGTVWRNPHAFGAVAGYMHTACEGGQGSAQGEPDPEQQPEQGDGQEQPQKAPKGQKKPKPADKGGKEKGEPEMEGEGDQPEQGDDGSDGQDGQPDEGDGEGEGEGEGQPDKGDGDRSGGVDDQREWDPEAKTREFDGQFKEWAGRPAEIKGNIIARHFETLDEMKIYATADLKTSHCRDQAQQDVSNQSWKGKKWFGTDGGAKEVMRMIDAGWPEGVQKMREAFKDVQDLLKPESIKRRFQWSDNGDEFDIHRAWSGQLDTAWRRMPKRPSTAPLHVKLIMNNSANCDVSADALFWRGAVALYLADALQEAGYHVEIIAAFPSSGVMDTTGNGDYLTALPTVTLKDARSPLEKNTLATALCLSGTMRTLGFLSWIKAGDDLKSSSKPNLRMHSGLGRAAIYSDCKALERGEYEINSPNDAQEGKLEIERMIKLIQGETTKEGKAAQ